MSEYIITDEQIAENQRLHGKKLLVMPVIVRCRDCKHHELMTVSYLDKPLSVCISEQWIGAEGDNPLVEPDGFCAWGERKKGLNNDSYN